VRSQNYQSTNLSKHPVDIRATGFCYSKDMNKYWFRKRKGLGSNDYGWGWVPITWQGWTLVFVLVASVFVSAFVFLGDNIANDVDPSLATVLAYIGVVVALIAASAFICYKKTRP